jgi:hypothetical protein
VVLGAGSAGMGVVSMIALSKHGVLEEQRCLHASHPVALLVHVAVLVCGHAG